MANWPLGISVLRVSIHQNRVARTCCGSSTILNPVRITSFYGASSTFMTIERVTMKSLSGIVPKVTRMDNIRLSVLHSVAKILMPVSKSLLNPFSQRHMSPTRYAADDQHCTTIRWRLQPLPSPCRASKPRNGSASPRRALLKILERFMRPIVQIRTPQIPKPWKTMRALFERR